MLHERSFNRNFHVFYIRREYRVNPYSQQWTSIPLVRPFAERVIVPIHFLMATWFFTFVKNKNHAAIARVLCVTVLMRAHQLFARQISTKTSPKNSSCRREHRPSSARKRRGM
jgi:hypothetical protein